MRSGLGWWQAVGAACVLVAGPARAQEAHGLVVDWKDGTSQETVDREERAFGVDLRPNSAESLDDALTIADTEVDSETLARIRAHPLVEVAEPLVSYAADGVPNDPMFGEQWHLSEVGVPGAWALSTGHGVTVAVVDTGVSKVSDLAADRLAAGWDFVDDDADPADDVGHGTHVAGTVGQASHNDFGAAGVAPGVRILPVRVLGMMGGSSADIADGIDFAVDHGAQVINLSLGGPEPSEVLQLALRRAVARGVTVVCAAGNSGDDGLHYPAAFPECLSVAATGVDGHRTGYSTFGDTVALSAPGGDLSTDHDHDGKPDGVLQQLPDGRFERYQGTSMASPHVAGTAALLVGAGVSSPSAIRTLLQVTARPALDKGTGAGRLDAFRAMAAARGVPALVGIPAALLILWLGVRLVKRREGGNFSVFSLLGFAGLAALVVLFVGVPGVSLVVGPGVAGTWLSTPLVHWPALVSARFGPNLVWWSVLPAAFVLAFGRVPKLRGVALGTGAGLLGWLVAAGLTGFVPVAGLPGGAVVGTAWLLGNAAFGVLWLVVALRGAVRRTL